MLEHVLLHGPPNDGSELPAYLAADPAAESTPGEYGRATQGFTSAFTAALEQAQATLTPHASAPEADLNDEPGEIIDLDPFLATTDGTLLGQGQGLDPNALRQQSALGLVTRPLDLLAWHQSQAPRERLRGNAAPVATTPSGNELPIALSGVESAPYIVGAEVPDARLEQAWPRQEPSPSVIASRPHGPDPVKAQPGANGQPMSASAIEAALVVERVSKESQATPIAAVGQRRHPGINTTATYSTAPQSITVPLMPNLEVNGSEPAAMQPMAVMQRTVEALTRQAANTRAPRQTMTTVDDVTIPPQPLKLPANADLETAATQKPSLASAANVPPATPHALVDARLTQTPLPSTASTVIEHATFALAKNTVGTPTPMPQANGVQDAIAWLPSTSNAQVPLTDSAVLPPSPQERHAEPTVLQMRTLTLAQGDQLGDKLGALLASIKHISKSTLSIQLQPQELGRLEVRIAPGAEQSLNLSISAQHGATRDLVEAHLHRLRAALDGQGYREVNVQVGTERDEQRDNAQRDPRARADEYPAKNPENPGTGKLTRLAYGTEQTVPEHAHPLHPGLLGGQVSLRSQIDAYA